MFTQFQIRQLCLPTILICGLASTPVFGATQVAPGAIELESERGVPAVPGDVDEGLEEQGSKNREFVLAPLPSRSPLLGWTLAVPAMFLYKPSFTVEEDTTWTTGAMAFYSENDSWGTGLFHKMSIGGDRWRLKGAAFYSDLNYDYFGIGGDPESSIPLNQPISMVLVEALRRVYPSLFVGLRASYSNSEVSISLPPDLLPPGVTPPDISADFNIASIAPRLQYDSRDNQFYPVSGSLIEGTISFGLESLGSDTDYEKYKFEFNNYRTVNESGVLAIRAAFEYAGGDAPFFVYPAFGSGADLRGYQTGTYRDRFLFAAQLEYRYRITPRIGAVGFAGVGTVADQFGKWDKTLPSIGAGLRWVIAPKNNLSLRFDMARGRDDTEFYLNIGEAF